MCSLRCIIIVFYKKQGKIDCRANDSTFFCFIDIFEVVFLFFFYFFMEKLETIKTHFIELFITEKWCWSIKAVSCRPLLTGRRWPQCLRFWLLSICKPKTFLFFFSSFFQLTKEFWGFHLFWVPVPKLSSLFSIGNREFFLLHFQKKIV